MPALYSRSMRSPGRPHPHVRLWCCLVSVLLLGGATPHLCHGQSLAEPSSDADLVLHEARRALTSGDYDTVEELTSSLSNDAQAVVLRAQAATGRGPADGH